MKVDGRELFKARLACGLTYKEFAVLAKIDYVRYTTIRAEGLKKIEELQSRIQVIRELTQ
jgi:hypothetical protein